MATAAGGEREQQQQQQQEAVPCEGWAFLDRFMRSGFRFHPLDAELIGYVRMRAAGEPLPFGFDDLIPTWPLYGRDGADPRYLFKQLPLAAHHPLLQRPDEFYVFSLLEFCHAAGDRKSRSAGQGTWKGNRDRAVVDGQGRTIGRMAHLTFSLPNEGEGGKKWTTTHWVMHEYRLAEEEGQVDGRTHRKKGGEQLQQPASRRLVLCRLRNTKGKGGVDGDGQEGETSVEGPPRKRRAGGPVEATAEATVASCSYVTKPISALPLPQPEGEAMNPAAETYYQSSEGTPSSAITSGGGGPWEDLDEEMAWALNHFDWSFF